MPTMSRSDEQVVGAQGQNTHIGPPFTEWLCGLHDERFAYEECEDKDEPRYSGVSASFV